MALLIFLSILYLQILLIVLYYWGSEEKDLGIHLPDLILHSEEYGEEMKRVFEFTHKKHAAH